MFACLLPLLLLAPAAEPGFTPLFDGQTLSGWTIREGPESAFYVRDGAIVVHEGANFPTWLRSARQYENFDFRGEYYVKGWINSGIYLHAPEHGRNIQTGIKIAIFHQQDAQPRPESNGAVFPLIPPSKVNIRNNGEWNTFRILMEWPRLQVWMNEEQVQNLDLSADPELRYRLRRGYLGLESLSYPIRFRNLRVSELPSSDTRQSLYETAGDLDRNWYVADGKATWEDLGGVLRADGTGYLATKAKYKDFEFQTYIRASRFSNGGIMVRCHGDKRDEADYEIQLHDVEGATYPTGSLYHFKRAIYPRIQPEQWYLFQLVVKGPKALVRINGETVMEYDKLDWTESGHIMIQAHQNDHWIEYKHITVKPLE
ncbi:MAG: DUF1080 domain-containing protein [Bryobacteraceae bacterium]